MTVPKKPVAKKPAPKPVVKVTSAAAHEAAVRAQCGVVMRYLIAQTALVHYPAGDKRVMTISGIKTLAQLHVLVASGKLNMDCSQAVTLVALVGGAKNPNGSGDGYTGTLLDTCTHITKAQVKEGDIRIYGGGTGHHAAMVMAKGADPLLFSHGSERGPLAVRDSVEVGYQPAGGAWLRLPI